MPEGFYDQFKTPQSVAPGDRTSLPIVGDLTKSFSGLLGSTGLSTTGVADVTTSVDTGGAFFNGGGWSSFGQKTVTRKTKDELELQRDSSTTENADAESDTASPDATIEKSKQETSNANFFKYPKDLKRYYISFRFTNYVRPNAFNTPIYENIGTIHLPMPANLAERNGVALNTVAFKPIEGIVTENVAGGVNTAQNNLSGIKSSLENQFAQTSTSAGSALQENAFGLGLATLSEGGQALGSLVGLENVGGTIQQLVGAIPNPHLTVMFQGVNLRKHSFSWLFAPETPDESVELNKIIRFFKKRMLPSKNKLSSAHILDYPSIVNVSLQPNTDQLYRFKKCMIESINVNHAPMGSPSFFRGTQYPTHILFEISLQEIEILTSEDVERTNSAINGSISGG